jgi:nucleotide-binding universal stress UspA family protein
LIKVKGANDWHHVKFQWWKATLQQINPKIHVMKTSFFDTKYKKAPTDKSIATLEINQAIIGLGLKPEDEELVKYFNFFAEHVRISSGFFVHVMPGVEMFDIYGNGNSTIPIEGGTEIKDDMIVKMRRQVETWFEGHDKMYVEYEARTGNPLEEIILDTKELKADLIVIGKSFNRNWHGITTKNLIRETVCNALIVPEKSQRTLEHIIVPIDFSPNSVRALQKAISLKMALKNQAKITCVHIYEVPNLNYYQISKRPDQVKEMIESNIRESFHAFINTYGGNFKKEIAFVPVQKDMPGTAKYIMETAVRLGGDFIIMGAKGHSKVELLLLGSVTERVLELNRTMATLVVK